MIACCARVSKTGASGYQHFAAFAGIGKNVNNHRSIKGKGNKMEKVKNGKKESKALQAAEFLSEPMALGEVFVKSGMFKDLKTQAEAVVKILAGKELGLAPLESMTNIYIVNGKVALQAKIIGSLIKKSPKYDYTVEKLDSEECIIAFYSLAINAVKEGVSTRIELGKSTFTIKDAATAGLVNKQVWKDYPRNMLFARALSNGARWYTADVFCGYTAEEIENTKEATSVITIDGKGKVKENGKT